GALAVGKALGRTPQCERDTVAAGPAASGAYALAALPVFGREADPRRVILFRWEARHVDPCFADDGLSCECIDAFDPGEVDARDAVKLRAEVEEWLILSALGAFRWRRRGLAGNDGHALLNLSVASIHLGMEKVV